MKTDIQTYTAEQSEQNREICEQLMKIIDANLHFTESKLWHAHPVWFIEGNPIVGYSVQKAGVKLMFWSGADFDEADLLVGTGKFKDASITYTSRDKIDASDLVRWLGKAEKIQWDYKNIVKRKGKLERLV